MRKTGGKGSLLVKSLQHRLSHYRVQKNKVNRVIMFTIQAHVQKQFLFGHFLNEELARLPRFLRTLRDGLHYTVCPKGGRGSWNLGRGLCSHIFIYHTLHPNMGTILLHSTYNLPITSSANLGEVEKWVRHCIYIPQQQYTAEE